MNEEPTTAKKVTIDRGRWQCGKHDGDLTNSLLTIRGSMCCLGFLAEAYGVPMDDLGYENEEEEGEWTSIELPSHLRDPQVGRLPHVLYESSPHYSTYDMGEGHPRMRGANPLDWELVIAYLNDSKQVDDDVRESWIATGFKELMGIDVEFVGKFKGAE